MDMHDLFDMLHGGGGRGGGGRGRRKGMHLLTTHYTADHNSRGQQNPH